MTTASRPGSVIKLSEHRDPDGWTGTAEFSEDDRYRFELTRSWEHTGPEGRPRTMVVTGCNPSTASAMIQDQTVRRCMNFAKREGCNRLVMVNAFARCALHPRHLYADGDPVGGLYNDEVIRRNAARPGAIVVLAYGILPARLRWRGHLVETMVRGAMHPSGTLATFGRTRQGWPKHPCRLGNTAELAVIPGPWR